MKSRHKRARVWGRLRPAHRTMLRSRLAEAQALLYGPVDAAARDAAIASWLDQVERGCSQTLAPQMPLQLEAIQ